MRQKNRGYAEQGRRVSAEKALSPFSWVALGSGRPCLVPCFSHYVQWDAGA